MKKLSKLLGLAMSALMMVGATVGVRPLVRANAADATIAAGENGTTCTVNDNDGIKVGTSKLGGSLTVSVGKGAVSLSFYAAAWNGVTGLSLNLTPSNKVETASVSLNADTGIAGNSPFTLTGNVTDYKFSINLKDINADTTLTFTTSSAKRFVMWGATYSLGGGTSSSSSSVSSNGTMSSSSSTLSSNSSSNKAETKVAVFDFTVKDNYNIPTKTENKAACSITSNGITLGLQEAYILNYGADTSRCLYVTKGNYIRNENTAGSNYYLSSVSYTFSAGVSTSLSLGCSFGKTVMTAASSPINNTAVRSETFTVSNSDTTKSYCFILNSNSNNIQLFNLTLTFTKLTGSQESSSTSSSSLGSSSSTSSNNLEIITDSSSRVCSSGTLLKNTSNEITYNAVRFEGQIDCEVAASSVDSYGFDITYLDLANNGNNKSVSLNSVNKKVSALYQTIDDSKNVSYTFNSDEARVSYYDLGYFTFAFILTNIPNNANNVGFEFVAYYIAGEVKVITEKSYVYYFSGEGQLA